MKIQKLQYRGYQINSNKLNSLWWISKDNFGVGWAKDEADAKRQVDVLIDGGSALDATAQELRAGQQELLIALMASVQKRLLASSKDWPSDWDLHELRLLLAYAFNREVSSLMQAFRGEGRKRRLAAQKVIAQRDLY